MGSRGVLSEVDDDVMVEFIVYGDVSIMGDPKAVDGVGECRIVGTMSIPGASEGGMDAEGSVGAGGTIGALGGGMKVEEVVSDKAQ